jgi:hypothetical protein
MTRIAIWNMLCPMQDGRDEPVWHQVEMSPQSLDGRRQGLNSSEFPAFGKAVGTYPIVE